MIRFMFCTDKDIKIEEDFYEKAINELCETLQYEKTERIIPEEKGIELLWTEVFIIQKESKQYTIEFTFETLSYCNLNVCINYNEDIIVQHIEDVKVFLKNYFLKFYEKCYWLEDSINVTRCTELYALISQTENLIRRFFHECLTKVSGYKLWDNIKMEDINENVGRKIKDSNQEAVARYINVDQLLMHLDITDFIKFFDLKYYVPKIDCQEHIKDLQNKIVNISKYSKKELDSCMQSLYEEKNLSDILKKYLSGSIKSDLHKFKVFRNDVMHSRLIDEFKAQKIKNHLKTINDKFETAIKSITELNPSKEQLKLQKELANIKYEDQLSFDGIELPSEEKTIAIFEEQITTTIHDYLNKLLYRNDVEIEVNNIIPTNHGRIAFLKSFINGNDLLIEYDLNISLELSEKSELRISFLSEKLNLSDIFEFDYYNGNYYFDEEQSTYMPVEYCHLDDSQLNNMTNSLVHILNTYFKDHVAEIDSMSYEIAKGRVSSPVSDVLCGNCEQPYICIDSDYSTVGTCLNCGEHNDLDTCAGCGLEYFASDLIDDELCPSCVQHINEQIEKE